MKTIVTSAFSINMLPRGNISANFKPLTVEQAREYLEPGYTGIEPVWLSAVGHPDKAAIFSEMLGVDIPANRINITITLKTRLLVGQYTGPRLPEGATTLPEGARIEWWLVHFTFHRT
jgi:hypothetical protein